ncbi:hypothetical protein ACOME3_002371 [Neoechinorhynchus agilis]
MSEGSSETRLPSGQYTKQQVAAPDTNQAFGNDASNSPTPGIRLLYDYRCLERPFYTKISDHFRKQTNTNQTMPVFPNPAVKAVVLNQDIVKSNIKEKCDVDPLTGEIMYPEYMLTVTPAEAAANVVRLINDIINGYSYEANGTTMIKYDCLRNDNFFITNQMALSDLAKTKLDDLGEDTLKAFFISILRVQTYV